MHLANALGVPLVGLFGRTNPIRTGPVFAAPYRYSSRRAARRRAAAGFGPVPGGPWSRRWETCHRPGGKAGTLAPPMPLLTVTRPAHALSHRNGVYPRGRRRELQRGEGRDPRNRRRIRLRQVGDLLALMCLIPAPGPDRGRLGDLRRRGPASIAPPGVARSIRGKRVSMIFQDPMTSLNPYLRISSSDRAPPDPRGDLRAEAREARLEMLDAVGINGAANRSVPPPILGGHAPAGHDRDGPHHRARRS